MEEGADLQGYTPTPADHKLSSVYGDHIHNNYGTVTWTEASLMTNYGNIFGDAQSTFLPGFTAPHLDNLERNLMKLSLMNLQASKPEEILSEH